MRTTSLIAIGALGFFLAAPALAQESTASFIDAQGNDVGTVTVSAAEGGIAIKGELQGIAPGEHGFHIHETGACDAAGGFESAGAHFEPAGHKHGKMNEEGPHAGDLDNIVGTGDGVVSIDTTSTMVALTAESLLDADGSALVVHADPDDYTTDPSGNSGDRIACAVIEAPQP